MTPRMTALRRRAVALMVGAGGIFYILGLVSTLLGAPPEVRLSPQALAADLWFLAWAMRP